MSNPTTAVSAPRHRLALGVALLASVCTIYWCAPASAASPASASGALGISEGSGSVFPGRSLVVSVPGRSSVAGSEVHVTENGRSVPDAVVTPLTNASAGDFGVVLVIDTSPSMLGAPLRSAMKAARALAARRTGQQELGVIEFDQTSTVALPLTDNGEAIDRALARAPRVGGGTHIYDALSLALQQLQSARVTAGAIILLSDGADRGSSFSESAVAAAARTSHLALYTIGVRDAAFDSRSLSMLARDGGGQFLVTDSSGLQQLFVQLEAGLVSRYVIHYSSHARPGTHVVVGLHVDGILGAGTLTYLAPSLHPVAGKHQKPKSFWVSTLALVSVSVGAALLLGLALVAFLATRVRRDALRTRVARFTDSAPPALGGDPSAPGSRFVALERLLGRARWWPGFKEKVEIAQIGRTAVELVAMYAVCTIVLATLLGVATGSPILAVLTLCLGPLLLQSVVRHRLRKQRDVFASQLPGHLEEVASAMRAGHSFVSAINAMVRSAAEPSQHEWGRVLADEQLGVPLEAAMEPLRRRMDCDDIRQVALVATLQQSSGGNMADVIDRVADGVRERADLRRELNSLTAQARLSRWVVTGLPPGMIAILWIIRPSYMKPLLDTNGGQLMLALAFVMVLSGSLIMRAITDIKA
jgi:tight adherence protein B